MNCKFFIFCGVLFLLLPISVQTYSEELKPAAAEKYVDSLDELKRTVSLLAETVGRDFSLVRRDIHEINSDSVSRLDGFKELSALRLSAAKENLLKDIEKLGQRLDSMQVVVGVQNSHIDHGVAFLDLLLTYLGVALAVAGVGGYFSVQRKVRIQTEAIAAKWFETHNSELESEINLLKIKLASIGSQAANVFSEHKRDVQAQAESVVAYMQGRMAEAVDVFSVGDNSDEDTNSSIVNFVSAVVAADDSGTRKAQSMSVPDEISTALEEIGENLKGRAESTYGYKEWNNRAFAAFHSGDLDGASRYWKAAAYSTDSSVFLRAQSLVNVGIALKTVGRIDDAAAVYEDVYVDLLGDHGPEVLHQFSKAIVNRAGIFKVGKEYGKALDLLDRLISRLVGIVDDVLRDDLSRAMSFRAGCVKEVSGAEKALLAYDEMLEEFYDDKSDKIQLRNVKAMSEKASLYRSLGDSLSALSIVEKVIVGCDHLNDPEIVSQVTKAYMFKCSILGETEEGLLAYDALQQRYVYLGKGQADPEIFILKNAKSFILSELGRIDEAVTLCREVIESASDTWREEIKTVLFMAKSNLSFLLFVKGDFEASNKLVGEFLDIIGGANSSKFKERCGLVMNSLGFNVLIRAKKYKDDVLLFGGYLEKSLLYISKSLDFISSKHLPMVLGNQAYITFMQGDEEAALAVFREAFKLGGESLYNATLKDLEINTIPSDVVLRNEIEAIWSDCKPLKGAE